MECSNGPTDGARNVTLASAENRTNVTLMCFPARSCVTLSVGNVTLITIQVHSNVTLAARNVTLTPGWAVFSNGQGRVLDSGRWPGPPFGPRASPCSRAAHNRAEHDCKVPLPVRAPATRRRSALAPPAILAGFGDPLASCSPKAAR
jgi:hypothetical protein